MGDKMEKVGESWSGRRGMALEKRRIEIEGRLKRDGA